MLASRWKAKRQRSCSSTPQQECHELGDHGTAFVSEEMVRHEKKHADWFEGQLNAIERSGCSHTSRSSEATAPNERPQTRRVAPGPAAAIRCRTTTVGTGLPLPAEGVVAMSRWVPPRRTWTVTVAKCRCDGTSSGSPGRRPASACGGPPGPRSARRGTGPGAGSAARRRPRRRRWIAVSGVPQPGVTAGGAPPIDAACASSTVVSSGSVRQDRFAATGWPSRPRPYVPPTGRTWPHGHAVVLGHAANEADTLPVSGVTTAAIRLKPQCLKCVWTLLGLAVFNAVVAQRRVSLAANQLSSEPIRSTTSLPHTGMSAHRSRL